MNAKQAIAYYWSERERIGYCDVDGEMMGDIQRGLAAAAAERDALADRLAALAQAGITTGEDGAVRWHGLTGAEIERMKSALNALRQANSLEQETGQSSLTDRAWREAWSLIHALAAAAGRGADGEAA